MFHSNRPNGTEKNARHERRILLFLSFLRRKQVYRFAIFEDVSAHHYTQPQRVYGMVRVPRNLDPAL